MIRLTDEEIQDLIEPIRNMYPELEHQLHDLVDESAKAQLKKVVGQIQEIGDVMPKGIRGNGEHLYVFLLEYYKALLEEVKE